MKKIENLRTHLAEWRDRRGDLSGQTSIQRAWLREWLPQRGSITAVLILIAALFWAQNAAAINHLVGSDTRTSAIAYQGRLADTDGNPLTDTMNMSFRLYNAAGGGEALWTEQWTGSNGVRVSDGLFNVMLGSLTLIPHDVITASDPLFLGITVGTDDEMSPRVQLGSVPFATQALTVPDGSITQAKAPFAPKVYVNDTYDPAGQAKLIENPVIYAGWFHGSDEGYETLDLSYIFKQIDAVSVTKARLSDGNSKQVTFTVTDASGRNRPIPSEIKIWAYDPDSEVLSSWIQAYVVIYGR